MHPFPLSLFPCLPLSYIVGVQDGESLAGKDSSEASETMSCGRHPPSRRRRSIQSRAMPRSRRPIMARMPSAVPAVARRPPVKPPRRAPAVVSSATDGHRRPSLLIVGGQPARETGLVPHALVATRYFEVHRSIRHGHVLSRSIPFESTIRDYETYCNLVVHNTCPALGLRGLPVMGLVRASGNTSVRF